MFSEINFSKYLTTTRGNFFTYAIVTSVMLFAINWFFVFINKVTYVAVPNLQRNDPEAKMPVLNMPLKLFDYANSVGGSAGGDYPNWQSARFDTGYRSFPTTTIVFKDYSNELKDLPVLPNDKEWKTFLANDVPNPIELVKDVKKMGDIVKRYAKQNHTITVDDKDVTGDGLPEKIIFVSDGRNHGGGFYQIVKDNKIIFTGGDQSIMLIGLKPDSTGNGFTMTWVDEKHIKDTGFCCSLGDYVTRFVYTNGKFEPLYEQEELYFEVENTEYKHDKE